MTAEGVLALRKETVFHSGVSDGHLTPPTDPTASLSSLPYSTLASLRAGQRVQL